MQNFKFNRFIPKKSKSLQRWRKTHKEKTKLYKKTWEETWETMREQQGVDGENDGENDGEYNGEDLTVRI